MNIVTIRKHKTYIFDSATWCCGVMLPNWDREHVAFGWKIFTVQDCALVSFGGFSINYCPWCGEKINIEIKERK